MKTDAYDELARAITEAGFFTNGVEVYGDWHRTTVCSMRDAKSGILSGNSFWVSHMPDGWFVGTWGGDVYRLPDGTKIAELCIAWLSHAPKGTFAHFDDWVVARFGLIAVPQDDFEPDLETAE
jgi:hypothetical protein